MSDDMSWYTPTALGGSLSSTAPTVEDLENKGDPRKSIKGKLKSWNLRLYNLHKKEDVADYQRQKLRLLKLSIDNRIKMARDGTQILMDHNGSQCLYQILEWLELDWKLCKRELETVEVPADTPEEDDEKDS